MANGASIRIKGEIAAAENLVIAGRVEGRVRVDAGILTLAPGSQVVGDVTAPTAVVNGRVDGNVAATELLDVRATAVVKGDLKTPALTVAEGAELTGHVDMPERKAGPIKFPIAV